MFTEYMSRARNNPTYSYGYRMALYICWFCHCLYCFQVGNEDESRPKNAFGCTLHRLLCWENDNMSITKLFNAVYQNGALDRMPGN